ncbi:hypothetical protein Cco03nite_24160 [Catellatospora coxensis]|uniref:J domain-containing protein n=2 Tax=Catellatospora coxensis TaxID=310354 RepID=A0A8J3P6F6_9ACTN|nr:hypothetical protein Cco03nite_24160 [Catellatospora coxensis]
MAGRRPPLWCPDRREEPMPLRPDHYQVLQIGRRAGMDDIRRAYHRLARHLHPDVTADPAAHERFRAASEAYEVLSDPVRRSRYDRSVAEPAPRMADGPPGASAVEHGGRAARRPWDDIAVLWSGQRPAVCVPVDLTLAQTRSGARRLICLRTRDRVVTWEVAVPAGVADGQRLRLAGVHAVDSLGRDADVFVVVHLTRGLSW